MATKSSTKDKIILQFEDGKAGYCANVQRGNKKIPNGMAP